MSVSPVALSVGLVNPGECWLLAYNVWLGVLSYSLFGFPPCGSGSLSPLSVVCSLWLLYLLACQSVPQAGVSGGNADVVVAQGPGCAPVTPRCILLGSCL